MPHISIKLFPGKSEEQKRELCEAIKNNFISILGSKEESLSIAFEEIEAKNWVETVYKPEIEAKWDNLYKQPGYNPYEK